MPPEIFDPKTLADLLNKINQDPIIDFKAAPIDLIMPAINKPIDEFINMAYANFKMAAQIIAALRDPYI